MDPHPPGTRFFHRLLDVSGHGSQSSFPTESEVSVVEATPFASARHVGVVLADDEACNTLFFDEGTCNTLFSMKKTCVVLNFGNHQWPVEGKWAAVTWWEATNIATTSGSIGTMGWMC